jgi:hypothetical protein
MINTADFGGFLPHALVVNHIGCPLNMALLGWLSAETKGSSRQRESKDRVWAELEGSSAG